MEIAFVRISPHAPHVAATPAIQDSPSLIALITQSCFINSSFVAGLRKSLGLEAVIVVLAGGWSRQALARSRGWEDLPVTPAIVGHDSHGVRRVDEVEANARLGW
ncbi:MAG: hypothetical protein H0U52_08670 [Chloroflexi bacterium]|nr:hypothetical protein [Chloroflexota bacterium]